MTVTYLLRLTEASEQRGNDVFDGEQQLEEVDA